MGCLDVSIAFNVTTTVDESNQVNEGLECLSIGKVAYLKKVWQRNILINCMLFKM
jgi:hypothetical protein